MASEHMVIGTGTIDPWQAYQFLCTENPALFGAWLRFTDLFMLSTSPITPGKVSFGVGGTIIALSDSAAEFEETMIKASAITSLLGTKFPETQYSP